MEFINNIFEENDNNKPKWIYHFIDSEENNKENQNVYLSNNPNNNIQKNNRKIKFPKFSLGLSTIISSIFKLSDIKDTIEKFLLLFIKPISKLLSNANKKEDAKKALFRISTLFIYFYYKYASTGVGILDSIISIVNPLDPESLIKKLIEKEIKNISSPSVKLDDILGPKESASIWSILASSSYKIISIIKDAANEKSDIKDKKQKLKDSLKKGMFPSEDKSK